MCRLSYAFRCVLVGVVLLGLAASVLAQVGRVNGTVTDENGDPIPGAQVRAENPSARPPVIEMAVDEEGRYSMIGFTSGQWRVSVAIEGYLEDSVTVAVTQSQRPVTADFQLRKVRHPLVQALGEEVMAGLDPDEIEAELEAADAAFNVEDWDGAVAGYEALLDKLPQLTALHSQVGQAQRANGNYEEALVAFEARLVQEPDNGAVKTEIARTRLAMGDLDAASDLEATATGLDASKEDLYNLGEIEFAKGDVDAAAGWYEKATLVDPNWALPIFKLALVALNKGDMDTAKAHFQKVVELDPTSDEGAQASATLAALP